MVFLHVIGFDVLLCCAGFCEGGLGEFPFWQRLHGAWRPGQTPPLLSWLWQSWCRVARVSSLSTKKNLPVKASEH